MSLRDFRPQALWVQVLFQSLPLSSPAAVSVLNVLVEEVIFGYVLGINRTLDNKFSPHRSPVDDFNQVYEVLFGFEASYEFSVIRRPAAQREMTVVRAFQCVKPAGSGASSGLFLPPCLDLDIRPDYWLFRRSRTQDSIQAFEPPHGSLGVGRSLPFHGFPRHYHMELPSAGVGRVCSVSLKEVH